MTKVCDWCRGEFEPLANNEHAQRFCHRSCKQQFERAARSWVHKAITNGSMSLDALKNGIVGKRVFPTSHDVRASERLAGLLAVNSPAWQTLAEAMTQQQFDALKDWSTRGRPQRS